MSQQKQKKATVQTSNEQAEVFSKGISYSKSFLPPKPEREEHPTEGEMMSGHHEVENHEQKKNK
ncbi:hypothetical protein [Thalassobacillus devorans]|uniref:hypothetical protein n=1 Tax=Thalassobacillus devorans TaxID=279813 RepID=UPI00048DAE42|nr:hypothetical protein [Thalassobacillus devorans]